MVDFDEDLEGLFKAAMADPSVTGEGPKKGAPKRTQTKSEDTTRPAPAKSTSAGAPAPRKQTTLPPEPAAARGNQTIPPKQNSPAMRAPTQAVLPDAPAMSKPPPSRSMGGGSGSMSPQPPAARSTMTGVGAPASPPPSRSTMGAPMSGTGAAIPTQPPSRSIGGGTGAAIPAQPKSASMAPKPTHEPPISRAPTQALREDALPAKLAPPASNVRGASTTIPPSRSISSEKTGPSRPAGPAKGDPLGRADAPTKPGGPAKRTKTEQPRTNLKLIDYAPDEPLIDHKGRAKPLYEPRTPRPKSWHPSRPIRILLGLFPGTRVMALESLKEGLPYTILGLLAVIPALYLAVGWGRTTSLLATLFIDDRWLLAHAGLVLVLILVFEVLRLASFFEERTNGLRAPRILAALTLPAAAIVWTGPELVALWPQLVEATWFAAWVLLFGGLAGSVWCAWDGTLGTPTSLRNFRIAGGTILALLVAALFVTHAGANLGALAGYAKALGFRTLPELLAKLS